MHIRKPEAIPLSYGSAFMHVSAPVLTRTYVYACLNGGGDMDLRFCISQRRRSYGLTPVHDRAPAGVEGEKA